MSEKINPADALLSKVTEQTTKTKKTKAETKRTTSEQRGNAKKRTPSSTDTKRSYRVNLALTEATAEQLRARAEAEGRSLNNYVERILLDHLNRHGE